jgi:hypothetical protein
LVQKMAQSTWSHLRSLSTDDSVSSQSNLLLCFTQEYLWEWSHYNLERS